MFLNLADPFSVYLFTKLLLLKNFLAGSPSLIFVGLLNMYVVNSIIRLFNSNLLQGKKKFLGHPPCAMLTPPFSFLALIVGTIFLRVCFIRHLNFEFRPALFIENCFL